MDVTVDGLNAGLEGKTIIFYDPDGNEYGRATVSGGKATITMGFGGKSQIEVRVRCDDPVQKLWAPALHNAVYINEPPTVKNQNISVTTAEDIPLNLDMVEQSQASDIDNHVLTVASTTKPVHGMAVVDNSDARNIVNTPDFNYNGSDSFSCTITDGNGGTVNVSVSVNVTAVNDAPAASDVSTTVLAGKSVTTDVLFLSGASDVEGNPLTLDSITTQPVHGTASILDGKAVYTADADYEGDDSFVCSISDGHGGLTPVTVKVTVSPDQGVYADNFTVNINEDEHKDINIIQSSAAYDKDENPFMSYQFRTYRLTVQQLLTRQPALLFIRRQAIIPARITLTSLFKTQT
jgi:hypothetical protein